MTSKECVEKMVEKYSWLCEQYAILTDRDEISLKGNMNAFKEYLAKQVLKDLEDFEWLKSRIGLKVLDLLPTHDKFELLRILGVDISEWENL